MTDAVIERNGHGTAPTTAPDEAALRDQLDRDGIDYLLAQWVDIHGTPRVKGVPASALHAFLGGSAGFAGAAARSGIRCASASKPSTCSYRVGPTAPLHRTIRWASTPSRSPATTSRVCRPTSATCETSCATWRASAGSRTRRTTKTALRSS